MKHFFTMISIIMLTSTFQVNASTVQDLGLISDNQVFGSKALKGIFKDDYTFTVPDNKGLSVSITNSFVSGHGKIFNFKATLDGAPLSPTKTATAYNLDLSVLNLATGIVHTLQIMGNASKSASYGGSIQIAQTPIPAAFWLFSSIFVLCASYRTKKHSF